MQTSQNIDNKGDLNLDNFDLSQLDKVLSEELARSESSETNDELEQNIMILNVPSIYEGMKKACELFDVSEKEIEYKVIEGHGAGKDIPVAEYQIEFRKKNLNGSFEIKVSEDKLSVNIPILFPKKEDNNPTSYMEIINQLRSLNIKYGVEVESIRNSVKWVCEEFDIMHDVSLAKGKKPGKGKDAELIEGVFDDLNDISYKTKIGKSLAEIFSLESREAIKDNSFPTIFVRKDDIIAITTLPTEGKPGIDVYDETIKPLQGKRFFKIGENIRFMIEPERIIYLAETTGYLEYEYDKIDIISPIWITPDEFSAYFVKLPQINAFCDPISETELSDIIVATEITDGILDDRTKSVTKSLTGKKVDVEFIALAEGKLPENGKDAYFELFFDKDSGSGKILEDGSIDFHIIERRDTIKANQLIAVKYLPTEGKSGFTINGKKTPAGKGNDKVLVGLNNIRVAKQQSKILYYSTIEGVADFIGGYGLSVNRNYEVKGNVDFKTGNIYFDGNVYIKGSVQPGFNVIAEGDIHINGNVNNNSVIKSGGRICIREGVWGKNQLKITAKGGVTALFIQDAEVKAEGDVIVQEYIINSKVETKGKIFTPSIVKEKRTKGSIINSELCATESIIANSLGSEVATNTKILAGFDKSFGLKAGDLQNKTSYCERGIKKISETLRIGYNDPQKFKAMIRKLHPSRRKPVVDMIKKLNQLIKIRQKLLIDISTLQKETDELPAKAEIVVRESIFPNVLIQIGNTRIKTDNSLSKVKYRLSEDRESITIEKLIKPFKY
ncbi:MAG: DUF342 domain-containing protein [bacterium]|nr:DUF342 domain-containing protein [bacterium]